MQTHNLIRITALLAVSLSILSFDSNASTTAYKYKDASGNISFSQTPPPITGVTTYHVKETPSNPNALQPKATDGTPGAPKSAISSFADSQKQAASDNAQKAAEAEQKKAACDNAQSKIKTLQEKTAHRLFITGPDGQPTRMSQDDFITQLAAAQNMADTNCNQ